jgi:Mor family transcriptional regulator
MSKTDSYQHLLYELTAVIREDVGMGEALAMQFADTICCGLARRNPGAYIYVPAVSIEQRRAMHAAIAAEFNGRNLEEICQRYGVSKTTVYKACAAPARGLAGKRQLENAEFGRQSNTKK